jgi:hypothetical protein
MSKNKLAEAISLRPSDTKQTVITALDADLGTFIWGAPGIGKSDIVRNIATSGVFGKTHVIDLRLALMEPTDLRGFPMLSKDENGNHQMVWAVPSELPTQELADQYDTVILFLDEMNSAPPSVQAAAYQLVLDRKIGQYVLPKNVRIVAAGNRDTDKGVTYRMPTPLLNRFVHINMEVDFQDWQDWAISNNIHPDVIGYLTVSPSKLHSFDPKSVSQGFATPRSWAFVSRLISQKLFPTDFKQQTALVAGCVGDGVAAEFLGHRRIAGKMPNPLDILSGKVTTLDKSMTNEISAKFSLTVNLAYAFNEFVKDHGQKITEESRKEFNNLLRFSFNNFQPEMVILMLTTLLRSYRIRFQPMRDVDSDLRLEMEQKYMSLVID